MTPDEKKAFKEETHTWHGCVHGYDTRIKMPCPSCGSRSLFIGSGGHITCGYLPCKSPLLSENIRDITELSKQKDERVAELEKEKLNLLTCAANQAEEIQRLEDKIKYLNEQWKATQEAMVAQEIYLDSLTARLSEALGALTYLYHDRINPLGQTVSEVCSDGATERFRKATDSDSARLLERDRLRDAVIEAVADMHRFYAGKLQKIIGGQKLKERFERLESHEKEGGV